MSKEIAPAFQFYAAEYLADINVELMSLEEEGCYFRLMAFCWREQFLPNDPESLARLCKGVKPTLRVLSCFVTDAQGNLRHPRLDKERKKQREWVTKSREAGYKSAEKRWGYKRNKKVTNPTDVVTENGNQDGNQTVTLQSSSSISSSNNKSDKPVSSDAIRLSEYLKAAILKRDHSFSNASPKSINRWATDIDKLMRIDGRPPQEIERVIDWCQSIGCFWGPNILSGKKLREKFNTLYGAMQNDNLKSQGQKALSLLTGTFGEMK